MATGAVWAGAQCLSPNEEKGQMLLGRAQEAHNPACFLQERRTREMGVILHPGMFSFRKLLSLERSQEEGQPCPTCECVRVCV